MTSKRQMGWGCQLASRDEACACRHVRATYRQEAPTGNRLTHARAQHLGQACSRAIGPQKPCAIGGVHCFNAVKEGPRGVRGGPGGHTLGFGTACRTHTTSFCIFAWAAAGGDICCATMRSRFAVPGARITLWGWACLEC